VGYPENSHRIQLFGITIAIDADLSLQHKT